MLLATPAAKRSRACCTSSCARVTPWFATSTSFRAEVQIRRGRLDFERDLILQVVALARDLDQFEIRADVLGVNPAAGEYRHVKLRPRNCRLEFPCWWKCPDSPTSPTKRAVGKRDSLTALFCSSSAFCRAFSAIISGRADNGNVQVLLQIQIRRLEETHGVFQLDGLIRIDIQQARQAIERSFLRRSGPPSTPVFRSAARRWRAANRGRFPRRASEVRGLIVEGLRQIHSRLGCAHVSRRAETGEILRDDQQRHLFADGNSIGVTRLLAGLCRLPLAPKRKIEDRRGKLRARRENLKWTVVLGQAGKSLAEGGLHVAAHHGIGGFEIQPAAASPRGRYFCPGRFRRD